MDCGVFRSQVEIPRKGDINANRSSRSTRVDRFVLRRIANRLRMAALHHDTCRHRSHPRQPDQPKKAYQP